MGCTATLSVMEPPTTVPPTMPHAAEVTAPDATVRPVAADPNADPHTFHVVAAAYEIQDKPAPGKALSENAAAKPLPPPSIPAVLPDIAGPRLDIPAPRPPAVLAEVAGPGPETAAPRLPLPSEKAKTTLPAYVIEPPDVLVIDGVRLIPKPPYRIEPLDVLLIGVPSALPDQPIAGPYTVTPDGTVNLGFGYGSFHVAGKTLEQAAAAVKAGLRLNNPQVSVALAQFRAIQQVRGEHVVGQDGTITLGSYGCVNVTGLTLSQAKCEVERHLARWLQDPLISVSVGGYNSKVYYVITDGGGFGQQVYRLPITGNETVLDAISLINGLPPVSSKRNIWLARPAPAGRGCYQILPVNWEAITEAGATETNWQLFPGDRVYVKADCFISFDNQLSKVLTPVERLLGATLLGTATVQSFRFNGNGNNNNGF
jgi:polysaccharide export outer membrane protein